MYSQLIYFIVIILVYSLYPPQEHLTFSLLPSISALMLLMTAFGLLTRFRFHRFERKNTGGSLSGLDRKFNNLTTQQAILSVVVFILMVYLFNLPDLLMKSVIIRTMPTLSAMISLGLFVGMQLMIWKYSYVSYGRIYHNPISEYAFIKSNLAFALPILLPWLMLTFISDLLKWIPDEHFQRFITSTQGEIIYILFFVAAAIVAGPVLIQKLWGCTPLEEGNERRRIENLCRSARLKFADILYWPIFDGKMITAGVMGFVGKFRYILVTPALLQMLSEEEMDSVIAHEIGHVKKRHMLYYLVIFSGYMVFAHAFMELIDLFVLVADYKINGLEPESDPSIFTYMAAASGFILTFILYFRFVFGYFLRNFEREADLAIFEIKDDAGPLIRTFEKIAFSSGIPSDKPNWHHYSIYDRIRFLKDCELDRSLVTRHGKKVKGSLFLFFFLLFAFGAAYYASDLQGRRAEIFDRAIIAVLETEVGEDPADPESLSFLGDMYQKTGAWRDAVSAYHAALSLSPDNPGALNNLAWLLATCPDPEIQNPVKALELAKKAARRETTPEILDTLAESFYRTGNIPQAIEWEKKALAEIRKNPGIEESRTDYFLRQLEKFEEKIE